MTFTDKVLVTGASGFLGRRTVEMLVEREFSVRALVRKTSKVGDLKRPGVEIYYGDVTDTESLRPAIEGVDFVIHTAADTTGTKDGARRVTIGGTRNILDLCTSLPVRKLVYISSCSVYGTADCEDGQKLDENAPLERYPERRGVYSWAKVEAEKLVLDYMNQGKVAITCLRPGMIYGPGGQNYTPMMGFSLSNKIFVVIRNDGFILPLVYLDNLVDAISRAMALDKRTGHVYNVVDTQSINKRLYIDTFIQRLYPRTCFLYVPYKIILAGVDLQERLFKAFTKEPFLNRYRLISSQNIVIYDSSKIRKELEWRPLVSFEEGARRIVRSRQYYRI